MFFPTQESKSLRFAAQVVVFLYDGVENDADVLMNSTFDPQDSWRTLKIPMVGKKDQQSPNFASLEETPTKFKSGNDQTEAKRFVNFTIPVSRSGKSTVAPDAALYATVIINTFIPEKKRYSKLTAGSARFFLRNMLDGKVAVVPLINYGLQAENGMGQPRDVVKGYIKLRLLNPEDAPVFDPVEHFHLVPENLGPIMDKVRGELSRLVDAPLAMPQWMQETARVYCDHYNNSVLPLPPSFYFCGFDSPDVDEASMRQYLLTASAAMKGVKEEWLINQLTRLSYKATPFDKNQWLALDIISETLCIVPVAQLYSPDDATYRNPATGSIEVGIVEMFDDGLRRTYSDCEDDAKEIIIPGIWIRDVYNGNDPLLLAVQKVLRGYVTMAVLLSVLGASLSDGGGNTAMRLDNAALFDRVGAHMMSVSLETSYFEKVLGLARIPSAFAAKNYENYINPKLPSLFLEGTGPEGSLLHESHYFGESEEGKPYYSEKMTEAYRRLVAPDIVAQKKQGLLKGDIEVTVPEFLMKFEVRKMMEDKVWDMYDMPSEFYRVQTTAFLPARRGSSWSDQKVNGKWLGQIDFTTRTAFDGTYGDVEYRGVPCMFLHTKNETVRSIFSPAFSPEVEEILTHATTHLPHNDQLTTEVTNEYADEVANTMIGLMESFVEGGGGAKHTTDMIYVDPDDNRYVLYTMWVRMIDANKQMFAEAGESLGANTFVERIRVWSRVLHENLTNIYISALVRID